MEKWVTGSGVVVSITLVGPAFPPWRWTAIVVDLDEGGRISALLEPKVAKKNLIVVGDRVRLEYQPGQDAGAGWFGRRKGLCKNVEVLAPVSA